DQLGRSKALVARIAGVLGLTNRARKHGEDERRRSGEAQKKRIQENGHPRGMLGKRHSDEFKRQQSERSKRYFASVTPLETEIRICKAIATKMERYGTGNPSMFGKNAYS